MLERSMNDTAKRNQRAGMTLKSNFQRSLFSRDRSRDSPDMPRSEASAFGDSSTRGSVPEGFCAVVDMIGRYANKDGSVKTIK